MNPIEKAVIECNGVWPSRATRNIVIGWNGPRDVEPHYIRFVDHDEDGLTRSISQEIGKPEFMDVRKRLENKPEQWPAKANILTFNTNYSEWIFGTYKDATYGYDGHWLGQGSGEWLEEMAVQGHYFGDASLSLEHRHEQGHKEGEGVKWDGEGSPGVGVDCEYRIGGNGISWHPCTVRYVLEGNEDPDADGWRAVIWCPHLEKDQIATLDRFQFRPIQSHRDKMIEAALSERSVMDTPWAKVTVMALAKLDMLKLPGEEQ